MSFESPEFESFENKEKTKAEVIEEIKALGGFEIGEAKEIFGKWIDQKQEKITSSKEGLLLNLSIAEVYRDVGDTENAIEAYYDVLEQANNEGNDEVILNIRVELNKLRGSMYE